MLPNLTCRRCREYRHFMRQLVHVWLAIVGASLLRRWCAVAFVMLAVANMGCASRYSQSYLQSRAPQAEIVQVCVTPPTVETNATVWAHNIRSRETKSDKDWEKFERFAETADVIYRYDPNAPAESTSRLPWPYKHMSCRTVSSSQVPSLPTGMKKIPISREMREALVAALLVDERLRAAEQKVSTGVVGAKRYLGQLTTAGYGPRKRLLLTKRWGHLRTADRPNLMAVPFMTAPSIQRSPDFARILPLQTFARTSSKSTSMETRSAPIDRTFNSTRMGNTIALNLI